MLELGLGQSRENMLLKFKGQLATVTAGLGGSLGLHNGLQARCWGWGQLHEASRARGSFLNSAFYLNGTVVTSYASGYTLVLYFTRRNVTGEAALCG